MAAPVPATTTCVKPVWRGFAAGRRLEPLLLAMACLCLPAVLRAQEKPPDPATPSGQVQLVIPRLSRPPRLEAFLGMQPEGDAERQMTRVTGFHQRDPADGAAATQKTDVYLGYDHRHLYVVFVAFDDQPSEMRANMSQREDVFGDETVEIQLDTFNDQRRAFTFLTNPYGVQWDALWTEGQGFDASFDTVWDSEGRLTDKGFVVRMAIPFESLRFTSEAEQTWGLILVRDIPRNNESSFWPRVSNRIEGRLNQAARLTGLRDISQERNLQLIPFATSRSFKVLEEDRPQGAGFRKESGDSNSGLDAKLVVADSLALDVTLNPDFSQVESDDPQVTVNQRFEVFFPEKRPFFLENASLFSTPINLLFTRRIADPSRGVRLTGKLGAMTLGALLIDDEAPGKTVPHGDPAAGKKAGFGVLRLSRDIGAQSSLGLIYTERRFLDGFNRVGGVDGRFKLGENWVSRFQTVASNTRLTDGTEKAGPATSVEFNRNGRKFNAHLHYRSFTPGFETQPGFIRRTDTRNVHQRTSYTFRPEGKHLVAWGPALFTERVEDHQGTRLDWTIRPDLSWQFRRQTQFGFSGRLGKERLRTSDFSTLAGNTDFDRNSYGFFARSRVIDALDLRLNLTRSSGINFAPVAGLPPAPAHLLDGNLSLILRPLRKLRVDTTYIFTRVEDAATGVRAFTNTILRSRWNWQFTRRASIRTIFQYDVTRPDVRFTSLSLNRNFNTDLLFTYRVNPWTALFAGFNTNLRNVDLIRTAAGQMVIPTNQDLFNDAQQFFIKLSYQFRL